MRPLSLVRLRSKPVTEGQEKGQEGPGAEADGEGVEEVLRRGSRICDMINRTAYMQACTTTSVKTTNSCKLQYG